MSLDYTISTRQQQDTAIPDINRPYGRDGWVTMLRKQFKGNVAEEDASLTGVEKYSFEHDIEDYAWTTNTKTGQREYTPMGHGGRKGGDFADPQKDAVTQQMYQSQLQGRNTATAGRTGYQQASQSVFDTSASRYAPAHQNVVNF